MFTLYGLCSYVASWMIESKGVWNLAKVRVSRLLGRARSVHRVKARKLKSFLLTLRDHFQIGNLLPIFWVIKNLHGGSVVVETSSTCLKDGCHCLCYTTWNIVKSLKVMGLFFLAKKRRAKSRFQEKVMVPVGRSTSKSAAVALPSLISAAAFTNLWDRFCLETDGAQT